MDLAGKVVLVTGGSSGIGLGIARALAAEGASVAIAGRDPERLQQAMVEGPDTQPLRGRPCDVTDRTQVADLFAWLARELGAIDILVNSAGMNVAQRMMVDVDPGDFDRILAVNTTGTFNCIHAALPAMRRKKSGLIVNVLSFAGWRVLPLAGAPYCTSKFASAALGTFVNLEEAGHGIKVTNLYPGEANTPLLDRRPSPPPQDKRDRMLQPEDIAACVVMVAKLPPRAVVPELVITPPHMLPD
jgi:NAD(P)-dependent dehydrogenase (short-subunit alcohol dehydrogenase family)